MPRSSYPGLGGSRYRPGRNTRVYGLLAAFLAFVVAIVILGAVYAYFHDIKTHQVTFKVTQVGSISTGNNGNGHKYLIYTNKTTYEDTDNLFHWKFDSSDIYGQFHPGDTYTCNVTGWRLGILSSYPDIIWCHDLTTGKLVK